MLNKGCLLLNMVDSLTPLKSKSIIEVLGDPRRILNARRRELSKITCLDESDISAILRTRDNGPLEKEIKLIKKHGVTVVDPFSHNYPELLKQITAPPIALYVQGDLGCLAKTGVAVVGTRQASAYGLFMAEKLSAQLARSGLIINSGLARGIDAAAHRGALRFNQTIAVLGSGLLNIYPRQNLRLAQQISRRGALVSEFPMEQKPSRRNFPRRNRIVSGLSRGVLVIEAPEKSGALITARFACEQNRDVFALPGRADSPLNRGTHNLIKEGAKLVENVDDILEELTLLL